MLELLDSELSDLEELDLDELDLDEDREDLELDESESESDADLALDLSEASADLDLSESSDPEDSDSVEESSELDLPPLPPHFAILYSFKASLFSRHFLSSLGSGVSPSSPYFSSHKYFLVKYLFKTSVTCSLSYCPPSSPMS